MLCNLKKNGFLTGELIQVYKTMLRPVVEYGAVVFHSSLTDMQDELLERLQNHALKTIFGPGLSARKMCEQTAIPTLRERRIELADKFTRKCEKNPQFADWFPKKTTRRSTRKTDAEVYIEKKARCDTLFNSPLYYFRRRLNGKGLGRSVELDKLKNDTIITYLRRCSHCSITYVDTACGLRFFFSSFGLFP